MLARMRSTSVGDHLLSHSRNLPGESHYLLPLPPGSLLDDERGDAFGVHGRYLVDIVTHGLFQAFRAHSP